MQEYRFYNIEQELTGNSLTVFDSFPKGAGMLSIQIFRVVAVLSSVTILFLRDLHVLNKIGLQLVFRDLCKAYLFV